MDTGGALRVNDLKFRSVSVHVAVPQGGSQSPNFNFEARSPQVCVTPRLAASPSARTLFSGDWCGDWRLEVRCELVTYSFAT